MAAPDTSSQRLLQILKKGDGPVCERVWYVRIGRSLGSPYFDLYKGLGPLPKLDAGYITAIGTNLLDVEQI